MRHTSKSSKRACARKHRFETEAEARWAAVHAGDMTARPLRPYRCHVGRHGERRHWHITKQMR